MAGIKAPVSGMMVLPPGEVGGRGGREAYLPSTLLARRPSMGSTPLRPALGGGLPGAPLPLPTPPMLPAAVVLLSAAAPASPGAPLPPSGLPRGLPRAERVVPELPGLPTAKLKACCPRWAGTEDSAAWASEAVMASGETLRLSKHGQQAVGVRYG